MNDDLDLDARLRSAVVSARRSVEVMSAFEARPPSRMRFVVPAVAVAAAAAAVAVGVGVAVHEEHGPSTGSGYTDSPGTETVETVLPDALPLVIGAPPAGYVVVGVEPEAPVERTSDKGYDGPRRWVSVFGDGDAMDPFAASDLYVEAYDWGSSTGSAERYEWDGRPVSVRGRTGYVCEADCDDGDGITGETDLAWDDSANVSIRLTSRSLDQAQLLAIADDLLVVGTDVRLGTPEGLPGPLDLLGRSEDVDFSRGDAAIGRHISYESTDQTRRGQLDLRTVPGSYGSLVAGRWALGPNARPVTVRGHDGWVASGSNGDTALTHVVWQETPGTLVRLDASGVDEAEVVVVAESLRPAAEGEWRPTHRHDSRTGVATPL